MADKLMYIPDVDRQNNSFCRVLTHYLINHPIKKSPKLLSQRIRNHYCVILWGLFLSWRGLEPEATTSPVESWGLF